VALALDELARGGVGIHKGALGDEFHGPDLARAGAQVSERCRDVSIRFHSDATKSSRSLMKHC
jgi:hypothetical protein